MKLNELYVSILNYCGLGPNDEGEINVIGDPEDIHPALIEGRRLVMPIQSQLKKYHPDKMIIFHPLQEHIDRGASDVVKKLQYLISIKINMAIIQIATDILKLAGSAAEHSKLDPDQRLIIRALAGADLMTAANFVKFVTKPFSASPANALVSIFLKKSGTYGGVRHSRVGITTFPVYELIKNSNAKKADIATFERLFTEMFPGSEDEASESYNSFSDSKDAPWLDAMLKTSYTIVQRINDLITTFGSYIEDGDSLRFDTNWLKGMDNSEQFRDEIRRIPDQRGNEGSITKPDGKEESVIQPKPTAQEVQTPAHSIPTPPPKEKETDAGPYRVADAPAPYIHPSYGGQPVPPQPYPLAPPPAYPPAGYPPGYPPPGYPPAPGYPPQPYQPARPTPGPDGKISLQAIEAVNPAVTMAGNTPTPLLANAWAGYAQQMPYDPRFAQPQVDPRTGRALAPTQQYSYPHHMQPAPGPAYDPRYDPRFDPRYAAVQPVGYDPRYGYPPIGGGI